jgi:predicted TPR repeat methyltransferase
MTSIPAAYFDRMYQADPDPWGYETTPYECYKYAATLAALPDRRFRSALEIGCSIGVFSRMLAQRCDQLTSVDFSEQALLRARSTPHEGISFERRAIPSQWPDQAFDLVVISEVLYYLSADDLQQTARRCVGTLDSGGIVLLVNWLGDTGVARTGDEAAEDFIRQAAPDLSVRHAKRTSQYRLDLLSR